MKGIRKSSAEYSKYKFLQKWNDINFFIEDNDKSTKKVFMELLKKIFKNKKIENIYALGGRLEVINQCRKANEKGEIANSIYIIDGDLYLMCGEDHEAYGQLNELKNLFILPKYCVENFLIEKNSVLEILDEEECIRNVYELESELAYEKWIEENNELFKDLYINYAIAQKIKLGVPLITYKITKLVSSDQGILDKNKVEARCSELGELIQKNIGKDNYYKLKNEIIKNINNDEFISKYVSGKDHLFPLLMTRLKSITQMKSFYDTYKIRLAKKHIPKELNQIAELYNSLN